MTNTTTNKANTLFSAGLGRGGRVAAWAVAFAGAGLWMYMENRDNGSMFSSNDIEKWNEDKKGTTSKGK